MLLYSTLALAINHKREYILNYLCRNGKMVPLTFLYNDKKKMN